MEKKDRRHQGTSGLFQGLCHSIDRWSERLMAQIHDD